MFKIQSHPMCEHRSARINKSFIVSNMPIEGAGQDKLKAITIKILKFNYFISEVDCSFAYFVPIAPKMFNRWKQAYKQIFPETTCTALVVWNQSYGIGTSFHMKISHYLRIFIPLNSQIVSVIHGLMLSDGHLTHFKPRFGTSRFVLEQSAERVKYMYHVFIILAPLCISFPRVNYHKNFLDKRFISIVISTRTYAVLGEIYNMWYPNQIKKVPYDLFGFFNATVLAHWIIGDGSFHRSHGSLVLCTDSFNVKECVFLINILIIKYGIHSRVQYSRGKPRIYIPKSEINKIRALVKHHISSDFFYKIGLDL